MRSPITSTALCLLLVAGLCACKAKRSSVQTSTSVQTTETHSGVSPRDTLIPVPAAHVAATLPLPPCGVDLPPTTARSERAWSTVAITAGQLSHSGGCDSLALAVTLYDTWQRSHQDKVVEVTRFETVTVTQVPKWAWWALVFGLAGLLRLVWPLLRPFL